MKPYTIFLLEQTFSNSEEGSDSEHSESEDKMFFAPKTRLNNFKVGDELEAFDDVVQNGKALNEWYFYLFVYLFHFQQWRMEHVCNVIIKWLDLGLVFTSLLGCIIFPNNVILVGKFIAGFQNAFFRLLSQYAKLVLGQLKIFPSNFNFPPKFHT